jgi:hypothetical protein
LSRYSYFFSYTAGLASGLGVAHGNYATTLDHPIRSYEDLAPVVAAIKAKNPGNGEVVIASWQRFEEEPSDD